MSGSNDISNLVISIDADTASFNGKIEKVKNDLNQLTSADENLNRAMQKNKESLQNTVDTMEKQAKAAQDEHKNMLLMGESTEDTQRKVAALIEKMKAHQAEQYAIIEAQDKLTQSYFRQVDSIKDLNTGMDKISELQRNIRNDWRHGNIAQQDYAALMQHSVARIKALTDAEEKAALEKAKLINKIKAQAAAQKLSATEMLRYKAAELGVAKQAETYIRLIDDAKKSTRALGLESAAVRREIGVMFSEATRGNFGQLRGSMITLANRGGWLDRIMTPAGLGITAGIGAVTAGVYELTKAYETAQRENERFNASLAQTGYYAGYSADQLQDMAKNLADQTSGMVTQHTMSDVMAKVVGTGYFQGEQLKLVAQSAAEYAKATGESVDKIISNFERIQDDPAKGIKELDKSMHMLTASQLQSIEMLEEQGKHSQAAAEAFRIYAKALVDGANSTINSLRGVDWALSELSKGWGNLYDGFLGWFRSPTVSDQIEKIKKELQQNSYSAYSPVAVPLSQQQIKSLNAQLDALEKQQKEQNERTVRITKQNKKTNAQIQAIDFQRKFIDSHRSQYDAALKLHQQNIDKINNLYKSGGLNQKDYSMDVKIENDTWNKQLKSFNRQVQVHTDAATKMIEQYQQKYAQMQAQINAYDKDHNNTLTEARQQYIALEQQISAIQKKSAAARTDDEKSILVHRQQLEITLKSLDVKEQELQHQKALNTLTRKAADLQQQLADKAAQAASDHAESLAMAGMGEEQRERAQQLYRIVDDYQQSIHQLNRNTRDNGTYGSAQWQAETDSIQRALKKRLDEQTHYYNALDELNRNWLNGANAAWQDFQNEVNNTAAMANQIFSHAFTGMTNAVTQFALTGKMDFKSFTVSVLSDLAKMEVEIAVSKALSMLFTAFGGSFGGGMGAQSGNFTPPAIGGGGLQYAADGGVFNSPDLSKFSGGIVSHPTFFAFARGGGVMGEAGPEAILPLKRGSNGKLGVVASPGKGSAVFSPTYNITIQNDGKNGQIGPGALQAIYDISKRAASDYMQQQSRDGGHLSGVYK